MAKYISHLDLTRCMARAMRRAHIPAWYTEGFNPHLFMTFAMPLSLGQEGVRESMDIKLPDDYDLSLIPEQMNPTMPEGLIVISATKPEMKPTAIASAQYTLTVKPQNQSVSELLTAFETVLNRPNLPVMKKTKQGLREVDLKSEIISWTMQAESEVLTMSLRLPAGNVGNINPSLLTDALAEATGMAFVTRFVRENAFDADGNAFA